MRKTYSRKRMQLSWSRSARSRKWYSISTCKFTSI